MAASLPHFNALIKPSFKRNTRRALQVMAHQSFRDEGKFISNIIGGWVGGWVCVDIYSFPLHASLVQYLTREGFVCMFAFDR